MGMPQPGYNLVQDEGTALARRTTMDFAGAGVTATDDSGNARTLVTIPGATVPAFATPTIVLGTAAAAGAASTLIRSDSTIVGFDTTVPVTQAFGDAAATGAATVASRRDHVHGMPAAPATPGMVLIASQTLSGTSTTITFSNIPQTYTSLRLAILARTDTVGYPVTSIMRFNGDSGNNYSRQEMHDIGTGGTPSTATVATSVSAARIGISADSSNAANNAAVYVIDIPSYTATTFFKTGVSLFGNTDQTTAGDNNVGVAVFTWQNTAAITSITLANFDGSNFIAGTSVQLYGVA